MLTHLIYTSKRKANCTAEEIEKILASCMKNNPPINITGVLLYTHEKFLQYVEGEYKVLTQLYDKIKLDVRHESVTLISMGPIEKKLFPSWHMGCKGIETSDVKYRTEISDEDKKTFANILEGKEQNAARVQNVISRLFRA